jgi:hypothetical protein
MTLNPYELSKIMASISQMELRHRDVTGCTEMDQPENTIEPLATEDVLIQTKHSTVPSPTAEKFNRC